MITLSICWKAIWCIIAIFVGAALLSKWLVDLFDHKKYARIIGFIFAVAFIIGFIILLYFGFSEMFCLK